MVQDLTPPTSQGILPTLPISQMDITHDDRFYVQILHEEIQNDALFNFTTLYLLVLISWNIYVINWLQYR